MRRVARAPAPHTLVAGCSDPQEQAQSGSSGTCAQHPTAAMRDAKAATRGRAKAADNVAAARTIPWAAPCWHWHARPGSLLLSCHVAPAPPQRLPTAREHHCLQNMAPKGAGTTTKPLLSLEPQLTFEQMHLRAPQRSEGPTPGTFGRDGAKGKRGVRSWAKAGQRRVGPDRRPSGRHAGRCARATSRVHRRTTATRRSRPLWYAGCCDLLRTLVGRLDKFCSDGHEIRQASSSRPQIAPPSARRAAAAALANGRGGASSPTRWAERYRGG